MADLTNEVARAFEVELKVGDVQFLGMDDTCSAKKELSSDEDVERFSTPPAAMQLGEAEGASSQRVIRAALPERLFGDLQQRSLAVLARGKQMSKFNAQFGKEAEFSVKFFECGHFRLKEAPPGGPHSPAGSARGVIVEGRWEETDDDVRLEFLLRFQEQARRRNEDSLFELMPMEQRKTVLTFTQEKADCLTGDLPSSLVEDGVASVELRVENVSRQSQLAVGRGHDDSDDEEYRELLKPTLNKSLAKQQQRKPQRREWEDDWESDEPRWPMYLGICLFFVLIIAFAWVWYEETYSPEARKEFDEL